MTNFKKSTLVLVNLIAFTFLSTTSFGGQWERSLSLEIPLINLSGELGYLTDNSNYIAAEASLSVYGIYSFTDVTWSRSTSEKHNHWLGAGAGFINWYGLYDNDYNFFDSENNAAYFVVNYKYFKNSLEGQGLYFQTDLKFSRGEYFSFISLGYNF